jgi:hypothetical protein
MHGLTGSTLQIDTANLIVLRVGRYSTLDRVQVLVVEFTLPVASNLCTVTEKL